MYLYTGSLHRLENCFDFSCASIPDGWWQFVKELIYIYNTYNIHIHIIHTARANASLYF